MSFIELDGFGDVKEGKVHPEGPADLRITKVEEDTSKKGRAMIVCTIAFEDGDEDYIPVREYLSLPREGDEEDTRKALMRNIKRFLAAFGVPFERNGFNIADLPGCTARLMVRQEEPEDESQKAAGVMYNRVNYPKLKDEE